MQFRPDDGHMCSKHVEAWNKLIVKQKFCASGWLITKINILNKCPRYVTPLQFVPVLQQPFQIWQNKYSQNVVPKPSLRYLLLMLRTCSVIVLLVCISVCTSGACKNNWIHSEYGVSLCIVSSKWYEVCLLQTEQSDRYVDIVVILLYSEKNILVLRFRGKGTRGTDCCFRKFVKR